LSDPNRPSTAQMIEPLPPGAEKRRGSRLMIEVPITVMGMDPLGEPFRETTATTSISCYGCKYRTKRYTAKDSTVTLEIRRPTGRYSLRIVHARVVWVQRPRHHRESFQIGLELEIPGNIWGIDSPPEDWFAVPGEETPEPLEQAAPPVLQEPLPTIAAATPPEPSPKSEPATKPWVADPIETPACDLRDNWETLHLPVTPEMAPAEKIEFARGASQIVAETREAVTQTVKEVAEKALAEELRVFQQNFSGRVESSMVEVLKTFADLSAEIVRDTREICRATTKELQAELQRLAREAHVADLKSREANLYGPPRETEAFRGIEIPTQLMGAETPSAPAQAESQPQPRATNEKARPKGRRTSRRTAAAEPLAELAPRKEPAAKSRKRAPKAES
jgi:hypothetical protein